MVKTPIKIQLVKTLADVEPSRIVAVKNDEDTAFSLYITDKNGVIFPIKDESGTITITNTDDNLDINGTDINISPALLSIINSALQSGDNISELVNDVGYLTIDNLPTFSDQLEVNAGTVSNKTIAPNTLAGWWTYVKNLAQTFTQKITFNLGVLFTPQTAPTHERGRVYFDDVNDCISFMDSITGTSVQVGYEVLMRARNNTGATITNGSVVYISGAIGQNSTVALAQANTLPTSEIIGIATHNIANNTVGKICVFGLVNDFNTSSFTDGQMLYLSASVAGGLTSTIPESPNFVVNLGVVEHAHPTQGKILVRPQKALANNNSLGTAQNIAPTQNAVKNYVDEKGYKIIAQNLTDSTAVTGTTAITTVETLTIPANTFKVGDTIILVARIIKTGTNGVVSHRHSIDGLGLFSQTPLATNLYHQIERMLLIKSSTITEEISSTSSANSSNNAYAANQRVNINWTIPQTLTIALNNNSASDSSIVSSWQLIRLRP